ncbi:endo-1,3(4)-beta-glucanase 1 [[Candida] railenensis]|uniref:glucan endo-1,3-beta-D-glucosidase n=1 Tax=[Candida] railenensis TaxID=45579 RepID=A0A9P0VWC6_9ASCO|nr:endo-1,3(4)-beta-glucanase 1 [[Candida] railenensis]
MLSSLVPFLLVGKAIADYTVTHTNYVTPDCFSYKLQSILPSNEFTEPAATGFPVVFVYGDMAEESQAVSESVSTASIIGTTSSVVYTINTITTTTQTITHCSSGACSLSLTTKAVPYTYTLSTVAHYTTTAPTSKGRKTKTVVDLVTDNSVVTTTTTLYSATSTPSATKISTSSETITHTEKNPLITQTVVSQSQSVTIDTSQYTTDLTLSDATVSKVSTGTSGSNVNNVSTSTASSARYSNTTSAIYSNGTAVGAAVLAASYSNSSITVASNGSYHSSIIPTATGRYTNSSTVYYTSLSGNGTSNSTIASVVVNVVTSTGFATTSYLDTTTTGTVDSETTTSSSKTTSTTSKSSTKTSSTTTSTSTSSSTSDAYTGDLFSAIDSSAPLSVFTREDLPLELPSGVDNDGVPYGTNKFYANLFLGDQTDMIWSYPYGLYWSKTTYFGFGVQHTNETNRVHGTQDTNNEDDWSYYYNPILVGEVIISATTLTSSDNYMFVTEGTDMSVLVQLSASSTLGSDYIEVPVVQGMGFTTAIYHGDLTAVINSMDGFSTLTEETSSSLPSNVQKFRATLFNGVQWLIYVTIPASSSKRSTSEFTFTVSTAYELTASESIDGLIVQYAVAPTDSDLDTYYDQAAGLYAISASVSGSVVDGTDAIYEFTYETIGSSSSGKTILFALPHHVESMTSASASGSTGISLSSTTKGEMYAYLANYLEFAETLQTDIQFLPWSQTATSALSYTSEQLALLAEVANDDLSVDIASTVASMDSNYYSGKVIDKYAYILLVVNDILQDEDVAKSTLASLKDAFAPFIANTQYYPLMYDTRYGGVTSTASNDGDTTLDFGSGYYNDHHFHYGYFVHAAAIVGYVDKKYGGTWAEDNKDWVNSLIRDVANPSTDDSYFPVSRMFDWFAGHSWAAGLFASGDGKNEESSSEDYNFSYGMKLWGQVIGDQSMESRGDLMLAVSARAMNKYFYYSDDNTVEPSEYIGNKVSGILFENKITYTTYFGSPDTNPEYVHGIHMLPITPASSLIRGPTFVQQEWEQQVETFLSDVDSGWTGILQLNRALYDADSSYAFFSSSDWKSTYLDNGQSRTWSLAYSGGIANAN